jgi:hypothetical protein
MGRPRIHSDHVMTATERQRRRRERLRTEVDVARVLEALASEYRRAYLADQDQIRTGVKRLLARWEREAAASKRWWRKKLRPAAKRKKR